MITIIHRFIQLLCLPMMLFAPNNNIRTLSLILYFITMFSLHHYLIYIKKELC